MPLLEHVQAIEIRSEHTILNRIMQWRRRPKKEEEEEIEKKNGERNSLLISIWVCRGGWKKMGRERGKPDEKDRFQHIMPDCVYMYRDVNDGNKNTKEEGRNGRIAA